MINDLAADVFHRLQRLSLLFHSRRTVGGFLSCLTGDTWCVYSVTSTLLISPMQHTLTLLAVGSVAWRMDPSLAALTLLIAPVLGGSSIFFGRRLKRRNRLNREAQTRLLSFVHQTLTVIPIVQAFGTEYSNKQQFRRLSADAVERAQRNSLLKNTQGLVNGLTRTIGVAIVIYAGGQRVLSGSMSVGSLLLFISYQRAMQGALQGLLGTYANLKSTEASVDRVFEILNAEEDVRDAPGARPLKNAPRDQRGHVRLDNVVFGYQPDRPVLCGVSLEALPGESIAIVGPTGVGKSTLASLIPRFYDPWQGQVLVNGQDVRHVKLKSLRNEIALVLQEPFLLPLTVAENIAYGRPNASRDAIAKAAVAANADEFIRRLPEGYDTIIGERGATLSGGEKQRLSIARALLKDASILILDEPTSALDAQTEELLLDAIEQLTKERTTIIIAHRLSTICRVNRIIVFEGGKIVEAGTHKDLMLAGHFYHRLHELQMGPAVAKTANDQKREIA
jgi:ATP-binding cassette subfamily B protein/subfamily B ATP-binding cassette protein MsbA